MKGTELTVQGIPNQVKGSSTHEIPNQVNPPTTPPSPARSLYTFTMKDHGGMLDEICVGFVT